MRRMTELIDRRNAVWDIMRYAFWREHWAKSPYGPELLQRAFETYAGRAGAHHNVLKQPAWIEVLKKAVNGGTPTLAKLKKAFDDGFSFKVERLLKELHEGRVKIETPDDYFAWMDREFPGETPFDRREVQRRLREAEVPGRLKDGPSLLLKERDAVGAGHDDQ